MSQADLQQTVQIHIPSERTILSLFGPQDSHRRLLERRLKVKLYARGEKVSVHGAAPAVELTQRVLLGLLEVIERGQPLFLREIERIVGLYQSEDAPELNSTLGVELATESPPISFQTYDQRSIQPKTPNQRQYLELISEHDITFGVGPAGTGKTYLAMACAIHALKRHEVKRIVLTRPAVEAGERLGFLPGSLIDKVNPYLRPLYDALFEMLGAEQASKAIEDKVIEVAPLAFMRGRTLNQSFVILDEAQNTTREQMRMFLTRLGYSSKAVITGDVTQTDLGDRRQSGLAQASRILRDVKGVAHMELTTADVVRHPLVRAIIKAYEGEDEAEERHRRERREARKMKREGREPPSTPSMTASEGEEQT